MRKTNFVPIVYIRISEILTFIFLSVLLRIFRPDQVSILHALIGMAYELDPVGSTVRYEMMKLCTVSV